MKKFYTDGVKTIKIDENQIPPEGFRLGRTFAVNPWNRGLTKADPRVARNTSNMAATRKKNNSFHSWNKGLTKDTCSSLKIVSEKVSASRKGKSSWNKGIPRTLAQKQAQSLAMKGRTAWNKGLNKDTNASMKAASEKLTGHACFVTDWQLAKKKEYETKKRNNSFNTSKPEKQLVEQLKQTYGEADVITQYRDYRYPYNCDVYIKSLDLFIELNGTIEHNGRPYDEHCPKDLAEAAAIKQKAEASGPNSRYWNVLKWWTEIDPKKLNTLRQNNLNFRIIYPNNLIIDK